MEFSLEQHRIIGGIGADDEYWRALSEGSFKLPRCSSCQRWTWPAHYRCGVCGAWDFKWAALEPVGVVYAWTRSWYTFERVSERAADVPYVTVLAEIPKADGARVLGILRASEPALHIGAAVRGVILPPTEKSKGYPSIQWELVG
jgi:uncharacterized OB-fold protein